MIGINLSGAEFGGTGTRYNIDYHYPTADELKYYAARGVDLIRLPVTWERLQPSLGGPLSTDELGHLKTFLADANALGLKVIVDVHNYGRYGGNTIGSSAVSVQQFADFWSKMASALNGNPAVVGYDLMNEPHDMGIPGIWKTAAQAAVDAIRKVDTGTTIYAEGDGWSSAHTWQSNNGNFILNDPAGKLVYEAHVYFDRNNSGTYANSYDADGTYANIGVDRLKPFADWLAANNLKGFIGEFGVPSTDPRWIEVQERFVKAMEGYGMSSTVWGGGFWWPGSYVMKLGGGGTADSLAFDALKSHLDGPITTPVPPPPPPPPPPVPDTTSSTSAWVIVSGTAGADVLNGTDKQDKMSGLEGDDTLNGSSGVDSLDGGAGTDTASYAGSLAGVDVDLLRLTQLGGTAEGDTLISIEKLLGSAYGDTLQGSALADVLSGGAGNDLLVGRGGADSLIGGDGSDTASYAGSTAAVDVDLTRFSQVGGDAAGDRLSFVENLTGSSYGDRLQGDAGANVIKGGDGADYMNGRGGGDWLTGGAGNDRFAFTSAPNARADHVTDFSSGDLLDFSGIDANTRKKGDQKFAFIGSSNFSGTAGQLRAYTDSTGHTYVQGDINGDRVADFTVTLDGLHSFTGGYGLVL